jgi:hypothetical protein
VAVKRLTTVVDVDGAGLADLLGRYRRRNSHDDDAWVANRVHRRAHA